MKKINLIGYACGWGAKKRGCKDAPEILKKLGLEKKLGAVWQDVFVSEIAETEENKLKLIADYCNDLCIKTGSIIKSGGFPVTLGGDHSMAVGTWSGVTKAYDAQGNFGLIWIDAHMDSHTPKTSHSGAYHGMPLACLLGYGADELRFLGGKSAKISPEHVCLIGVRSFEAEEKELLEKLGIRVFYMDEVKKRGLDAVIKDALAIVHKAKGGYGITIDIDAFDPADAPGTGSLEKDGILKKDAVSAFKIFSGDPELKALEIAEYNPNLDKDNVTFELIADLLDAVLGSVVTRL